MSLITLDRTIKINWSTAWMTQFELFGIDFLGLGRNGNGAWWAPAPTLVEQNSDMGSVDLVFEDAAVDEDGFWMCMIRAGDNETLLKGTNVEATVGHNWRSIFTIPASENYREITLSSWYVTVSTLSAEINEVMDGDSPILPPDFKFE